jgi:hypothetical protein
VVSGLPSLGGAVIGAAVETETVAVLPSLLIGEEASCSFFTKGQSEKKRKTSPYIYIYIYKRSKD